MGHIELAAPVSHIWYFKGIPSRMGLILDLSPRVLERVLYFASYIVLDPGETKLAYKQILNESEYQEACDTYGRSAFRVGMGAESIHELLAAIDLEKDSAELKAELENATGQKRARIIKRLEVVEAFRESGNKPEWMIMTVIPVIPPDLRPMVQLDEDVSQQVILTTFTDESSTVTTVLEDFLILEHRISSFVTRNVCFRRLSMHLSTTAVVDVLLQVPETELLSLFQTCSREREDVSVRTFSESELTTQDVQLSV